MLFLQDYDYLISSTLPDRPLVLEAMPTNAFLKTHQTSEATEQVLDDFEAERKARIQVMNACAQESTKLAVQNCFGEMLKKCVKRKKQCEAQMNKYLTGCNLEELKALVRADIQDKKEELSREEQRKLQVISQLKKHQEEFALFLPDVASSSRQCGINYLIAWDQYCSIARDLNGFFRLVHADLEFTCFETLIASSLGHKQELSFSKDIKVEDLDCLSLPTRDSSCQMSPSLSSLTTSVDLEDLDDLELDRLSNDCISMTEERARFDVTTEVAVHHHQHQQEEIESEPETQN